MGAFASIYHPVGIPMIVQNSTRPGFTIGLNGLAGNLGIAFAAILTGFLVQQAGWRMAFAVPVPARHRVRHHLRARGPARGDGARQEAQAPGGSAARADGADLPR